MRDEGLIEFEVWGEAVEVEDEGFEVEWEVEAEGKLWRKTLRKGRVPAIIWESNRTSTLQHLVEISLRFQLPLLRHYAAVRGGSLRRLCTQGC